MTVQPSERALNGRLRVIAASFNMTLEELADYLSAFAGLLPAGRVPPPTPRGHA